MRILLLLALFLVATGVFAQVSRKTKLPLEYVLNKQEVEADRPVHLFLKGEQAALRSVVAELGGHFKYVRGRYAAAILRFDKVGELDNYSEVEAVHFELTKGFPMLSTSRQHTRTNQVHDGEAGLVTPYTGAGVIIGVIDAGIDLNHPDFMNPDSTTRILELWDQNLSNSSLTPSYGYGRVYDSAMINAGQCPHVDQPSLYGHGTNTAGIAAGNGQSFAELKGHAPDADLIIVSTSYFVSGGAAVIADAVDYIFSRAEFYGKPCVINASLGNYSGSHDGRDVPTQIISDLIQEKPGRIMVCAAGNSGEFGAYHLGYTANNDTSFTWFKTQNGATAGNGEVSFEIYGDVGDMEGLQFSIGADRKTPNYAFTGALPFQDITSFLNTLTIVNLVSNNGNYLGTVNMLADSTNGTYRLAVYITNIDSIEYYYRLSVTGQGRLDLWSKANGYVGGSDMVTSNLPSVTQYSAIANYKLPDDKQTIVSNWACSEQVITVGNFTNRTSYNNALGTTTTFPTLTAGAIAASSSSGPNRTGALKPEVSAPGEVTLAPGAAFQINAQLNNGQGDRVASSGMHHRASGTSSAAPVVAGIAAMFLEMCPEADWQDFKTALTSGAVSDIFTSTTPNDRWGNGKADAVNTLNYHKPQLKLSYPDNEFCDGDTLSLSVKSGFESYKWINGSDKNAISVTAGGIYYCIASNGFGCLGSSDTVSVFKRPNPEKPTLLVSGDNPSCSNEEVVLTIEDVFGAYEWSEGSHLNEISVSKSGNYWCQVKNIYGCTNESDTANLTFMPGYENPLIHFQSGNVLMAISNSIPVEVYNWYRSEELIQSDTMNSIQIASQGVYRTEVVDSNGCIWTSDPLYVYALGQVENNHQHILVYPNPTTDFINITNAGHGTWKLFDAQGLLMAKGNLNTDVTMVDMSDLSSGIYLLRMQTMMGMFNGMVVRK